MNTPSLVEAFQLKADMAGLEVACPADGFFNAEIAIVAEAPGEREVNARIPLVGGSGNLLWNVLRKHGITRSDCYITNVAKRQVAFDVDERRAPLGRHEFELWAELLRWELLQLPNLKVIVALGNYALKALTGHDGITAWRGSVLPVVLHHIGDDGSKQERRVRLVASFNPAAVLRKPGDELIFHLDMSRIQRVREDRWHTHDIEATINPSADESIHRLGELSTDSSPIAYDIETIGGETACIGFANNGLNGLCINFRDRTTNRYTTKEEQRIRTAIQNLFDTPGVKLIAQNNMFDASWLWFKDKLRVPPIWIDTMLAHHCLYPQMPHNLGYICTQYTTHPYYKDEKSAWREGGNIDSFWEYNVKDCCITWSAAHSMLKELEKQNLADFFFGHVMRVQPHLVRMAVGGVLVDTGLKRTIDQQLGEELEKIYERFYSSVYEATGLEAYRPNPLSPRDISDLLFNKLRLVGRGASTNDENRERMYKDRRTSVAARQVLDNLNRLKEESKFLSTYVKTAIDDDDRIRCEWKQTGVSKAPGRLSSAKSPWGHYDQEQKKWVQHGMNLQNQPPRAKQMFIADEGYTFWYFDLAQAESWYVGYDAGIGTWIEQHQKSLTDFSYDAHRALASTMFNIPYDEVPSDDHYIGSDGIERPTIRYKAKRARHGLNYRMQADRLSSTSGIPLDEAQRVFEIYHRLHPELRKWWRSLEEEARQTRMLYNSYGRRLFIQGRLDDPDTLESIVAYKPQSTVGDKVTRVIALCESDPRWPATARVAMNVHDALIGLCRIEEAELCLSIAKLYAQEPLLVKGKQLIIRADCGISEPDEQGVRRWSTIKKVKGIEPAPPLVSKPTLRLVS